VRVVIPLAGPPAGAGHRGGADRAAAIAGAYRDPRPGCEPGRQDDAGTSGADRRAGTAVTGRGGGQLPALPRWCWSAVPATPRRQGRSRVPDLGRLFPGTVDRRAGRRPRSTDLLQDRLRQARRVKDRFQLSDVGTLEQLAVREPGVVQRPPADPADSAEPHQVQKFLPAPGPDPGRAPAGTALPQRAGPQHQAGLRDPARHRHWHWHRDDSAGRRHPGHRGPVRPAPGFPAAGRRPGGHGHRDHPAAPPDVPSSSDPR
jgi:hypothetical protein